MKGTERNQALGNLRIDIMHGGTWLAVDRTFQVGISQWPEGRELLVDFRNRKDTSLAAMKSKGGNIRNEAREIIRAIDHYSVRN